MSWSLDARLPVTFAPGGAEQGDAYLVEQGCAAPKGAPAAAFAMRVAAHPPGCACCLDRGAVAQALDRLFLARVRGEAPPFGRVVALTATDAGRAAVAAALAADPVVSARFRLA